MKLNIYNHSKAFNSEQIPIKCFKIYNISPLNNAFVRIYGVVSIDPFVIQAYLTSERTFKSERSQGFVCHSPDTTIHNLFEITP